MFERLQGLRVENVIRCVNYLLVWMERWGCHIYSAAFNCVIGRRRGVRGLSGCARDHMSWSLSSRLCFLCCQNEGGLTSLLLVGYSVIVLTLFPPSWCFISSLTGHFLLPANFELWVPAVHHRQGGDTFTPVLSLAGLHSIAQAAFLRISMK